MKITKSPCCLRIGEKIISIEAECITQTQKEFEQEKAKMREKVLNRHNKRGHD